MDQCLRRPRALRALAVVLVLLVASSYALQVRDGGLLLRESAGAVRFVSDAFPTAEAGVVSGR